MHYYCQLGGTGRGEIYRPGSIYDSPQGVVSVVQLYYVSWGYTGMASMVVPVWDWGCAEVTWGCEEVGPGPVFKPLAFPGETGASPPQYVPMS